MTKCYGCGAPLQTKDKNKEGYTKSLENTLCERCFKITHYNNYFFLNKSNSYYLNILKEIQNTGDLVLLVTDFLNTIDLENINIKNPIILVLTKRDIIPRSLDETKLLNRITSKLNIKDKIIVCAKNNYHLDELMEKIEKYQKSQNVYVIGYTSSGKSTLINKIIQNYSVTKTQITTSILPSTTLDKIEVTINKSLTIIDTPGLLDEGSLILNVDGKTLNKIMPKKELKPMTFQIKQDQTIIIENIIRLDVKENANLTFYFSNDLKIERLYKTTNKLNDLSKHSLTLKAGEDIVIKGLGFIKATKNCKVILYLDKNIKYKLRQSII